MKHVSSVRQTQVTLHVNALKLYFSYTISVGVNLKLSSRVILQLFNVRVEVADLSTQVIVTPVSLVRLVYWLTSSQTIVKLPLILRCFGGWNFCWLLPRT